MYAFELPPVIPPAGTPDGPPLPGDYRKFANIPIPGDARLIWITCIRDPNQLQPTWDRMMALGAQMRKQASSQARK